MSLVSNYTSDVQWKHWVSIWSLAGVAATICCTESPFPNIPRKQRNPDTRQPSLSNFSGWPLHNASDSWEFETPTSRVDSGCCWHRRWMWCQIARWGPVAHGRKRKPDCKLLDRGSRPTFLASCTVLSFLSPGIPNFHKCPGNYQFWEQTLNSDRPAICRSHVEHATCMSNFIRITGKDGDNHHPSTFRGRNTQLLNC